MASSRPDRTSCASRSSLDSGFESANSIGSPESASHESGSVASSSAVKRVSPLALCGFSAEHSSPKKLRVALAPLEPLPESPPKDLASKLIDCCTSPKSTAEVRRLLQFCTASTSSLPSHGRKEDLKQFISTAIGDKTIQALRKRRDEAKAARPKGTFGNCLCCWDTCEQRFETDNDLFDHVNECHLLALRPTSGKTGADTVCLWSDCELSTSRGDPMKRFDWLVSHVTLRHTSQAHPHKCVFGECTARFRTPGQLNNHFKNAHKDDGDKRTEKARRDKQHTPTHSQRNSVAPGQQAFCYFEGRRLPRNQLEDNVDPRFSDWLLMLNEEALQMQEPCVRVQHCDEYEAAKGAERRKQPLRNRIALVDDLESPEAVSESSAQKASCLSVPKCREVVKRLFRRKKVGHSRPNTIKLNGQTIRLQKAPGTVDAKNNNNDCKSKQSVLETTGCTFEASQHVAVTDATFDEKGRKLMEHWLAVDAAATAAETC